MSNEIIKITNKISIIVDKITKNSLVTIAKMAE
jgi:hypothetical protein